MRLTKKRNGKNVIPLLNALRGIDVPYWRIDRAVDLHSYLSGDAADKLAAYEDAEEQGLLVRLPCKVGDTVYSPRKNGILEQRVDYICMEEGEIFINVSFSCDCDCVGCPHNNWQTTYEGEHYCNGEYGNGFFAVNDFGKTVFLTCEEAEAALKGGRDE